MRLQVKGKNVEVSEQIRSYAETKLAKLQKRLPDPTEVELELTVEHNPSIAANHVAEVTVWTKGPTLRAREAASDMKASIDQIVEKLERQVIRYREKRRRRDVRREDGGWSVEARPEIPDDTDELGPVIVKVKQFAVKPMTPEEAVLQLELIGHEFFVFQNADSGEVNVVYRRRDGAYGLIEPQT